MPPKPKDEDRPGGMIDIDGWVIGGTMLVDWLEPGDVIAHQMPGYSPILYRYERQALRSEYGQTYALGLIPKPWRLVWRNPTGRKREKETDDG